jgi:hypothetical protein
MLRDKRVRDPIVKYGFGIVDPKPIQYECICYGPCGNIQLGYPKDPLHKILEERGCMSEGQRLLFDFMNKREGY